MRLQKLGAEVRLAAGLDAVPVFGAGARGGVMHVKAVVLDDRIAYAGSSNLTKASRVNRELVFRLAGPPVAAVLAAVAAAASSGELF